MPSRDTEKEKELRVWMEHEFFDKIEKIKDHIGLKNVTELIRFLINEKYNELFEKTKFDLIIDNLLISLKDKKKEQVYENLLKN